MFKPGLAIRKAGALPAAVCYAGLLWLLCFPDIAGSCKAACSSCFVKLMDVEHGDVIRAESKPYNGGSSVISLSSGSSSHQLLYLVLGLIPGGGGGGGGAYMGPGLALHTESIFPMVLTP